MVINRRTGTSLTASAAARKSNECRAGRSQLQNTAAPLPERVNNDPVAAATDGKSVWREHAGRNTFSAILTTTAILDVLRTASRRAAFCACHSARISQPPPTKF